MIFSNRKHRSHIPGIVGALIILLFGAAWHEWLRPEKLSSATSQASSAPPISSPAPVATLQLQSGIEPAATGSCADRELGDKIDHVIDASPVAVSRWGISVISLRDGRTLYARNADRPITPASNMKLYTTAVALDLLGADYRWRTSVLAAGVPDAGGTLNSDLVLYGRGAPDLASRAASGWPAQLPMLADQIYRRGIRRVTGRIIGDESYFRGELFGDGWQWNDLEWYFGAEPSALSINGNEVTLTVIPPARLTDRSTTRLLPDSGAFDIRNETTTVDRSQLATVGIARGLSSNEIRLWGDSPVGSRQFNVRLAVNEPARWAARLFRDALLARGISVDGGIDARDAHTSAGVDTQQFVEIAYVLSQPLAEIVRETNKESLNLDAELILRSLGKEHGNDAPDPSARRMAGRGDDEAGLAVIRAWLDRAGIPTASMALHDGSGLSRLDLITPDATTRLLATIGRTPSAAALRNSLPIAGYDGTLRTRLARLGNYVQAKTGTLTSINALSGYATAADQEPLAFSIICNDEPPRTSAAPVIDAIVQLLVGYKEKR